jgi:hypothetical protein
MISSRYASIPVYRVAKLINILKNITPMTEEISNEIVVLKKIIKDES